MTKVKNITSLGVSIKAIFENDAKLSKTESASRLVLTPGQVNRDLMYLETERRE